MIKRCIIISFALTTLFNVCGQQISYNQRTYGSEDGLASSEIYCAFEDSKGYLWFGTEAGVSRFNGYNFTNYSVVDGLIDNTVINIYEDNWGRIWFLGLNNGICYFYNDEIHTYKYNEELKDAVGGVGWISQIVIDSNETIKFNVKPWGYGEITAQGEVFFEGGNDQKLKKNVLLHENKTVLSVTVKETDSCFLTFFKFGSEKPDIAIPTANGHGYGFSLWVNGDESFFVGEKFIAYINSDTILTRTMERAISTVNRDENGRVWIGYTAAGIQVFNSVEDIFNGSPPVQELLAGYNVSQILDDKGGGLWLTVENRGICYIYNIAIENYHFDKNDPNEITAMCLGDKSDLFYTTEKGDVYHFDSLGKHELILNNCLDPTGIFYKPPSQLYISSFKYGTVDTIRIADYTITFFTARGFCIQENNEYWQIDPRTAYKSVNGELIFETEGYNFFKTIVEDQNNTIWIGGNSGLFKYENDQITNFNQFLTANENTPQVNKLECYQDGLLASTKNDGLIYFEPVGDSLITRSISFDKSIVKDVFVDNAGVFWVATNKGIVRVTMNPKELDFYRINHLNGMPSDQVNCITGIGDWIFAGTNNGFVRFNKHNFTENTRAPQFQIESIKVNEVEFYNPKMSYELNHNQNDIEISFVGLSYRNAGEVNYRYILEGVDNSWKFTKSRKMRYPSLPPGNYIFKVAAANEDNIWCDEKEVRFTIDAPFWVKWWFIAGVIIVLLSGILYLYFLHERRKVRQFKKVSQLQEQKRKMIEAKLIALRAQMNPHFTFNTLAAIQDVMMRSSIKEAMNYMTSFSVLIRKILEHSEDMFITIDEELEMLKLYIELENLRLNNTIYVVFDIQPDIDLDFTKIPSMVIQPFVENAIIHGLAPKKKGKRELKISLKANDEELFCIVEDSGIGRKRSQEIADSSGFKEHRSLGIKITQERIKLYNSDEKENFWFKITDCRNENGEPSGTRIAITFKKKSYDSTYETNF